MIRMLIEKSQRRLTLQGGDGQALFQCRIGLGRCPEGKKRQEGDGRTPEGVYRICLVKPQGKYGRSYGLSYPGRQDADEALAAGRIDAATHRAIIQHLDTDQRPPWGTPLGGEIYIHEGGSRSDWTQGCIALDEGDMDRLEGYMEQVAEVAIVP